MIQGIIDILIEDAGVQGQVGLNKAGDKYKVYPVACPQSEDDPYIVLTITGADITQGKNCDANLNFPSVDIYCYGKKYEKADALSNAVCDAINTVSSTRLGYIYKNIHLTNYKDGWDTQANLYVRISSYRVSLSRTTET